MASFVPSAATLSVSTGIVNRYSFHRVNDVVDHIEAEIRPLASEHLREMYEQVDIAAGIVRAIDPATAAHKADSRIRIATASTWCGRSPGFSMPAAAFSTTTSPRPAWNRYPRQATCGGTDRFGWNVRIGFNRDTAAVFDELSFLSRTCTTASKTPCRLSRAS
jgi:hypothetical protein